MEFVYFCCLENFYEDVNSTRRKLVIVNTHKLTLVTVLKSGKRESDYGFIYLFGVHKKLEGNEITQLAEKIFFWTKQYI